MNCSRLLQRFFITCIVFKAFTVDSHDNTVLLLFIINASFRKNHLSINKNFIKFTFFTTLMKIMFSASDLLSELVLKIVWMSFLSENLSVKSDYLAYSVTVCNSKN